jgi:adenylate cyclase
MGVEIERKFLVKSDEWQRHAQQGRRFFQGHVARQDNASVRIRRTDTKAFVTIKGPRVGITRAEFEYEIPLADAEEMLSTLCLEPLVEKTRYCVPYDGVIWEVDVYGGQAEGLVMAEVELENADQNLSLPTWVGWEVTGDPRYQSSAIVRAPHIAKTMASSAA